MDRSLNRRPRTQVLRYSYNNPPESEEQAMAKIEQLNEAVVLIETDLGLKKAEHFRNADAYETWRQSAVRALGWSKTEHRFLERWLAERGAGTLPVEHETRYEAKERHERERQEQEVVRKEVEQQLALRVREFATTLGGQYVCVYGIASMPENPSKAEERYVAVQAVMQRIEEEFAEVKAIGGRHGLGKIMQAIRFPLHQLVQKITVEKSFLYHFLRNALVTDDASRDEQFAESQAMRELVQGWVERLQISWPVVCVEPALLADVDARMAALTAKKEEILAALQKVGDACREHGFAGRALKSLKSPLVDLLDFVEKEVQKTKLLIQDLRRQREQEAEEDRQNAGDAKRGISQRRLDELAEIANSIRMRTAELAAEIGQEYTPVFNAEYQPQDLDEATARHLVIAESRRKLQAAFSEVTEAWTGHPLNRKDLPGVKRPLTDLLHAVETESSIVTVYVKKAGGKTGPKGLNWKSVCVRALTRATTEGFKLEPEEQEVFQWLLTNVTNPS